MTFRTRFAPSPTGPLHLGHAFSALTAGDMAIAAGGEFLLRIEDIDQSRARPEWEAQIYDDLSWLELTWPEPVMRQSERLDHYTKALQRLWDMDLLFACTCTRRDIAEAASAPQEGGATLMGPDGIIYPGTCRANGKAALGAIPPQDAALRLRMDLAADRLGTLHFTETGAGPNGETGAISINRETLVQQVGDVVLARREMGTSYHLAVVLDDAAQQISHVVRGTDLFEATAIHVVLQHLLGFATPVYHHHKLIRDHKGKRLAKRDDARAISLYRSEGWSIAEVRAEIGL